MQIFVSGSLAYDRIMDFPGRFADHILPEKIHILNVCFMVNGLTERFGGTAGNIAYNLALLKEKPVILATAGKDFGPYREWLTKLDLPLDGIKEIPEEFTAGAYITTDLSDNQITGFNPGAMKHRSDYRFDRVDPAAALAIVAPGSLEDMLAYTRAYKARGVPYIFDPGQSIPAWGGDELQEMADQALALIVNDYELEMFQQKTGLNEAEILGLTPTLITTRGDSGSYLRTRRRPGRPPGGGAPPDPGPHRRRRRLPGRAAQGVGPGAFLVGIGPHGRGPGQLLRGGAGHPGTPGGGLPVLGALPAGLRDAAGRGTGSVGAVLEPPWPAPVAQAFQPVPCNKAILR